MVLAFALVIRVQGWPGASAFNVWVNLPQFDPPPGGDVVSGCGRTPVVNLALGLLLPLIAPILADLLPALRRVGAARPRGAGLGGDRMGLRSGKPRDARPRAAPPRGR
jgi:hypothetical protein